MLFLEEGKKLIKDPYNLDIAVLCILSPPIFIMTLWQLPFLEASIWSWLYSNSCEGLFFS